MTEPLRPRRDDRRLTRDRSFALRRLSAPLRALPDFLIIGEMKCGTSSLFGHLRLHPQVHPPMRKEIHYFGHGIRQGKGLNWYRAHFPRRSRLGEHGVTGEATPGYLYDLEAVPRIARALPAVRMIVLLRDPVERAISHYYHEVRMGRETLPIAEAIDAEEARIEAAQHDEDGWDARLHAVYKRRGIYADSLARLFAAVPRERVLVVGSGLLFRDPSQATARCVEFLGLPRAELSGFAISNQGVNREATPPELRSRLEAYFEPHNARLFDLLGERPDWDEAGAAA